MTSVDCVIVGAGIGGLALAHHLSRAGRQVLLVEKGPAVGGVITTVNHDGFLLEKGPNSFSSGAGIMELIAQCGLADRAIQRPIRDHDRFVWKNGALRKVPMGPGGLIATDILTFGQKARLLSGLFRGGAPLDDDVPMGAFFRQRIGDAPVDALLKPFMAGVYASDADRISLETALPPFFDAARAGGSLFKILKRMRKAAGPRPPGRRKPRCLVSFPDGLRELPDALASRLQDAGVDMRLNECVRIDKGIIQRWRVALASTGEVVESSDVVFTSAADDTADVLAAHTPELAAFLRDIEYAALTVIHVGIPDQSLAETRNGFGFLSVPGHDVEMLGSIWSSSIFPGRAPRGQRLLTCFYGGDVRPAANTWDDEKLLQTLKDDLRRTMKLRDDNLTLIEIERWQRALPLFRVGHRRAIESLITGEAGTGLPAGLHLMANYLGRVSMPDRVNQARLLADRLAARQP